MGIYVGSVLSQRQQTTKWFVKGERRGGGRGGLIVEWTGKCLVVAF